MKIGNLHIKNRALYATLALGGAISFYGLKDGQTVDSFLEPKTQIRIVEKKVEMTPGEAIILIQNQYSSMPQNLRDDLSDYVLEQTDPDEKWDSMNDQSKVYFIQHGYRGLSKTNQRRALHVLLRPALQAKFSHVIEKVQGVFGYGVKRLEDELQDEDPVRFKSNYETLNAYFGGKHE